MRCLFGDHQIVSLIVSMQNGFNETTIAECLGEERTTGACINYSGDYKGPADLLECVQGNTYIDELNGEITPRSRHKNYHNPDR